MKVRCDNKIKQMKQDNDKLTDEYDNALRNIETNYV